MLIIFIFQRMIPIDLIDITEGKISDFMIDFKKVKKNDQR